MTQATGYIIDNITIKEGSVIVSPDGHAWKVKSFNDDTVTFEAGGALILIHFLDIKTLIALGYTVKP